MKHFSIALVLIIWMLLTFILAISVIGFITVMMCDGVDDWMAFGNDLISQFKDNK